MQNGGGSGALDSLIAAVTAAASSDLPNTGGGTGNNTSANLDAIFNTDSFSSAYRNASEQREEESISPLWARMLLNHFVQSLSSTLLTNSNSQHPPSSSLSVLDGGQVAPVPTDMVQTTRSGRISRPPIVPGVNHRLLEDLQNGGMESVINALRSTDIPIPHPSQLPDHSSTRSRGHAGEGSDTWSTRPEVASKAAKLASAVPRHLSGWQNHSPLPLPSGSSTAQIAGPSSQRTSAQPVTLTSQAPRGVEPIFVPPTPGVDHPPRASVSRARIISDKYFQSVKDREAAAEEIESGNKRAGSFESSDEDEPLRKVSRDDTGETRMRAGKRVMSKEEALERRRERNKRSAMLSRQKRKMKFGDLEERLGQSEACIRELEEHCEALEEEVERLRNLLTSNFNNGNRAIDNHTTRSLPLSPAMPSPIQFTFPTDEMTIAAPPGTIPGLATLSAPTVDSSMFDSSPFGGEYFDINAFFSFNDDEDDGEFIPRSSPKRSSDSEGEEEDITPQTRAKRAKEVIERRSRHSNEAESDGDNGEDQEEEEEEEDDEFEDEEEEDEDLFLPIEDVPYPPEAAIVENVHDLTGDMMRALKVDTRQQLAAVMQKLVDSAGEGGVTEDIVERLKSVISLAKVS